MYEKFYGLNSRPFTMHPDPYFLYWGHNHSLAYSMLEYAILNEAGFTVITGEIGSGKTTLLRQLLHNIDERITVGLISNTMVGQGNLLEWILLSLNQPFDEPKYVALLRQFQERKVATGEMRPGGTLVIYATRDGSTWTAIRELPDGVSCFLSAGVTWRSVIVGRGGLR